MGRNYNHLSKQDRDMIAVLKAEGKNSSQIAKKIGRHRSTLCRELERNSPPVHKGYYLSHKAQERTEERMSESHTRERLKNQRIRDYVEKKLKILWSPEIIAGRISKELPGEDISHEAIYQYIYEDRSDLIKHLVRPAGSRHNASFVLLTLHLFSCHNYIVAVCLRQFHPAL